MSNLIKGGSFVIVLMRYMMVRSLWFTLYIKNSAGFPRLTKQQLRMGELFFLQQFFRRNSLAILFSRNWRIFRVYLPLTMFSFRCCMFLVI